MTGNSDTVSPGTAMARLLVLDDEAMTGETLCRMASFAGFDARHCTSPDAFFAEVDTWQPDIIALDLLMPEMDGVEVVGHLARRQCEATLILTSGVGGRILQAAARAAEEHGLTIGGVLPKPFTTAQLRNLLEQAQQARARRARRPFDTPDLTVDDLDQAIASGHIFPMYQPKVFCRTGSLAGFEVLARWQHPAFGRIGPDQFIPLAESSDRIGALTRSIAAQALDWVAQQPDPRIRPGLGAHAFQQMAISLNISARSLGDAELFDWLFERCTALGIAPQRMILELTESSAMQNPATSLDNLTRLRMRGFHLSIDDFGTGFSSMLQLVRLPFSEIKVDKSFVMTSGSSAESRSVIRSIVDLGHSLGLATTAEGIEDDRAMALLRQLKCQYAQGYHISPPMMADAVVPWFLDREMAREAARLKAVQESRLLDTPSENRFDRITRLAKRLFDVPIALITMLDDRRQWFKSVQGLAVRETPRDQAFCAWTVERDDVLIVENARTDQRFSSSALVVGDPHIGFYAGVPLCLPDGNKIGALCLIDTQPRTFRKEQQHILREMAAMAEQELAVRHSGDHQEPRFGLLGRDSFVARAQAVVEFCQRLDLPLAAMVIQITGLEMVNARLGQIAGDQVIHNVSAIVGDMQDDIDLFGRYRNTRLAILTIGADDTTLAKHRRKLEQSLHHWLDSQGELGDMVECWVESRTVAGREIPPLDKLIDGLFR